MIQRSAKFSPCRIYRYSLSRTWQSAKPYCLFICLNPSTANELEDDPTVTRCMRFTHSWGYGGMIMANLFAFRATKPPKMKAAPDPIGPENDEYLKRLAAGAGITVAGWGNDGDYRGRAAEVARMLTGIHCLRVTSSGQPTHPLYLPKTLTPILWEMPV